MNLLERLGIVKPAGKDTGGAAPARGPSSEEENAAPGCPVEEAIATIERGIARVEAEISLAEEAVARAEEQAGRGSDAASPDSAGGPAAEAGGVRPDDAEASPSGGEAGGAVLPAAPGGDAVLPDMAGAFPSGEGGAAADTTDDRGAEESAPDGGATRPDDATIPAEGSVDGTATMISLFDDGQGTDLDRVVSAMAAAVREGGGDEWVPPAERGGTLPGTLAIDNGEDGGPDNSVFRKALAHGEKTAEIAGNLFDVLAPLHGLDARWRELLLLSARFHDVGLVGGRRRHHRMSMRLIDTDPDLVEDERLRPYVALLARYHRKAVPSRRHSRYAVLPRAERDAICRCMVLLRVANAFARTVPGDAVSVGAELDDRRVRLGVRSAAPLERGIARARRWRRIFERYYGRKLDIVAEGGGADAAGEGAERAIPNAAAAGCPAGADCPARPAREAAGEAAGLAEPERSAGEER